MATFNKELKWVITEYGKRRITELLSNPEERVRISVMQIGDDNSGEPKDREYQDQLGSGNGKLFHQVGADIPVYEKGISEVRENTVYFKATIGEELSGFNICEMALYEERNGELKMFAVGTGEPLAKPDIELGYLITIDYTLNIESANLLTVYDQIELNPNNEFLKKADIEGIFKTMLYVEGNLAVQIGGNTHILGLNRAQQLNDIISNTKLLYSSTCLANYYANMSNSVTDLSKIIGFWSFAYTDVYGVRSNIKDFSPSNCNFSTNTNLGTLPQEYIGAFSSLQFDKNTYFYLDKMLPVICVTSSIELGPLLEWNETGNLIYTSASNSWYLNGVAYSPEQVNTKIVKYYLRANSATTTSSTITLGSITADKKAYAPHTFTYNSTTKKWTDEIGNTYDTESFKVNVVPYNGEPNNGDTISLTSNYSPADGTTIVLTGERFDLLDYKWETITSGPSTDDTEIEGPDTGEITTTSVLKVYDSPFTFMASLEHINQGERNILLAQCNPYNNIYNWQIVKTENNAIEMYLYTDKNNYYKCWTNDYVVPNGFYNLIITYNGNKNKPDVHIYINGTKPTVYDNRKDEDWAYTGMTQKNVETTSYLREVGTDNKVNNINAKICLLALIKEEMSESTIRCNSLLLNSMCGKNIYYKI